LTDWFAARGWRPRQHQLDMLAAARRGEHALLVAATGAGKTLAGFLPTLAELIERPGQGLHTLYMSPLKALAVDVQRNLLTPDRGDGLDDQRRDAHRRYAVGQEGAPAQPAAEHPADHARIAEPAAVLSRQFHDVRRSQDPVIDEVHAFATGKRGDLLSAGAGAAPADRARAAPRRAVGDGRRCHAYRAWLAPAANRCGDVGQGEKGADPDIAILLPEGRVPWAGIRALCDASGDGRDREAPHDDHLLQHARARRTDLPGIVEGQRPVKLPIAIHHGSLEPRGAARAEQAMADGANCARLVATASLDLGVDWGDVDCVIQMGAPKGSSRLLQRIGRANHRLDEPSEALIVPGNRFEYLEARAALDAVERASWTPTVFRPGALDVLAQHVMALRLRRAVHGSEMLARNPLGAPYSALDAERFALLGFIADGGYALKSL
jgi:ATP-dependent Lhr-like helicase